MLDWRLIKISLLQKDFGVIQKNMFTQILIFVPLPPVHASHVHFLNVTPG